MYKTTNLPNTRIQVADALRGIAVAGIILIHSCEHFNLYWSGLSLDRAIIPALEKPVTDFMWWLFAGKMYTIFALLFGLSFYVQSDNQAQRGNDFTGRFTWRMILLCIIGMVNTAFYNGDVLVLYSILGLLMPWLGKLPTRWLWAIFAFLVIQPFEMFSLLSGIDLHISTESWDKGLYPVLEDGGFIDSLIASLRYGQPVTLAWYFNSGRVTQTLSLFILGMLLGRMRMFYDEPGNMKKWLIAMCICLFAAVVLYFFPVGKDGTPLRMMTSLWYNFAHTLAMVSATVLLWYSSKGFRRVIGKFSVIGRMSLSNYLLQSILGSMVFYSWGFCLYREVGLVYGLLAGIGIVTVQYIFSYLWLRHHTHGPVEWVWKKLTWIKLPL